MRAVIATAGLARELVALEQDHRLAFGGESAETPGLDFSNGCRRFPFTAKFSGHGLVVRAREACGVGNAERRQVVIDHWRQRCERIGQRRCICSSARTAFELAGKADPIAPLQFIDERSARDIGLERFKLTRFRMRHVLHKGEHARIAGDGEVAARQLKRTPAGGAERCICIERVRFGELGPARRLVAAEWRTVAVRDRRMTRVEGPVCRFAKEIRLERDEQFSG